MRKNINFKKVFALVAVSVMALSTMPMTNVKAATPAVTATALSSTTVKEGGSVSFTLKYYGDIKTISLKAGDIAFEGFTANIKITESGNDRIVTLSNIKSTSTDYTNKLIHIAGGTAISSDFKMVRALNSKIFTIIPKDTEAPKAVVSAPSKATVYAGESVSYTVTYTDNEGIKKISLKDADITLDGFTATKNVVINSNNTAVITLSNIQGEVGGNKVIHIAGGTAIDADFNMANKMDSVAFIIAKKEEPKVKSKAPTLTISAPNPAKVYAGETVTYTLTYKDDVKVKSILLTADNITLHGFTADKKVVINKDNTATLTLTNVQGEVGGNKIVSVAFGTAIDDDDNKANSATSTAFTIEKKAEVKPEVKPQPTKPADWKENPNTGIEF